MEKLKTGGLAMDNIWMIGGAARSPLWPSIAASLTGTAVTLTHYPHGPALGAAILPVRRGVYPDFETGRACFDLQIRQVFRTNPTRLMKTVQDYAA